VKFVAFFNLLTVAHKSYAGTAAQHPAWKKTNNADVINSKQRH